MKSIRCALVKVKDEKGKQILHWAAPLLIGSLSVRYEGGRVFIEKKGMFGTKTYVPAITESVETQT